MEIVFVRHGQTDLNKDNCIQGASVDQSLNESGRAYAKKAAANFDPSPFDVVYSSPMKRAVETAQIFTKGSKDIVTDERLVEFDFGEWDGQSLVELGKAHPDAVDPWGKADEDYIKYAPSGESFTELDKRCGAFLAELVKNYPDQKFLIVCHGTLIRMMIAHLFSGGKMVYFDTIKNCALAKVSYCKGVPRLNYYNKVLA